ncbi:MAG: hypothetical protein DRG78_01220 [Epsilonproteobacteria bacterium]|nr:MAG: hypothetical protein DRG78_01220 [Campylobacterota bacterium]
MYRNFKKEINGFSIAVVLYIAYNIFCSPCLKDTKEIQEEIEYCKKEYNFELEFLHTKDDIEKAKKEMFSKLNNKNYNCITSKYIIEECF